MFLRVAPPPAWACASRAHPIVSAAAFVLRQIKARASPEGSVAREDPRILACADVLVGFLPSRCAIERCDLNRRGDARTYLGRLDSAHRYASRAPLDSSAIE
mmetsp:Transcript_13297/g.33195  ORF Transcript_13297/g.33195 Transcript_13297/m.33195 type:complete len:102 (-) Transcript_13297:3257-3562(-)